MPKGILRFFARLSYFYFSIIIFGYGSGVVDYPTGYCDFYCEWVQSYAFYGQMFMVMPISLWLSEWHQKRLLSPLQDIRKNSLFWCGICFGGGLIYWCGWHDWVRNFIPVAFINTFFIILAVSLYFLRATVTKVRNGEGNEG